MTEEQKISLDSESPAKVAAPAPAEVPAPAPAQAPAPADVTKDVVKEEKVQNPPPEQISDDSKALAVVESNFSFFHIIMDYFL